MQAPHDNGGENGASKMGKGKRKTVIVLDTETAPIVKMGDVVDANKMRVYDLGYIVRDKYTGEVYAERSFVCADTFFNGRRFMDSAYYAEKLPQYYAGIATGGEWEPVSFADAYKTFHADCETWGVSEVWAYNSQFDEKALNATCKDVSAGMVETFTALRWRDIWRFAECITGTVRYCEWATAHGYVTATGTPCTGVEYLIKYLDGDTGFSERHTALDDARHESRILSLCLARGIKQPTKTGYGYRAAQRWAKQTGHYIPKEKRQK